MEVDTSAPGLLDEPSPLAGTSQDEVSHHGHIQTCEETPTSNLHHCSPTSDSVSPLHSGNHEVSGNREGPLQEIPAEVNKGSVADLSADYVDSVNSRPKKEGESASPMAVISFSPERTGQEDFAISSVKKRRYGSPGDNQDTASSATPVDPRERRKNRCYFTIVIPNSTHQQTPPELSDMGSEDLDDEDRKRTFEGDEFCPNYEVASALNANSKASLPSGNSEYDSSLGPYMASPDSKFEVYAVVVDRKQDDKASEIALCSMERPHMRGFHFAWISMFVSFLMWFAITPLLSEIQISLNLTKAQIWTSSVFGTTGTIVMRVIMGPLCDKYGSRLCMSLIVLTSAIPTGCTGLVNTANGLNLCRLCVGIAGASFVSCEYWTSSLFIKEISGTANSLVSGWGNLGGGKLIIVQDYSPIEIVYNCYSLPILTGITQIMMGSVIFPLLKFAFGGEDNPNSATMAWRLAFIFPSALGIIMGVLCWKFSDDCPKGNYIKRERQNLRAPVSAFLSLTSACWEFNTWIFVLQYACCFGVEFAMNNAAPLYFRERFDLTTEASAAVASIFGFLNLFARGMGGFISDVCNARFGMKGRILWMFSILFLQGCSIIVFGYSKTLAGAITTMIIFSLFVQASEGSVYAIVPYVNPSATGSISGVVGAGGTAGGAVFAVLFREYSYETAFAVMGAIVSASSFFSFALRIRGFENALSCGCKQNPNETRTPVTIESAMDHTVPADNFSNEIEELQRL